MSGRSPRRATTVKRPDEIDALRRAADVVSGVHAILRDRILPGTTTASLDAMAEEYIRDHGGSPAFKGYIMGDDTPPYPSTLCMSLNDIVVHGFPSDRPLEQGDIISVDVGVKLDDYYGDCACTYAVGTIDEEKEKLLRVTRDALMRGVEQAGTGKWIYDIAGAVQRHVESEGFSVVRELVGHGIGRDLHEDPAVPNFVPNPFSRHRFRNQRLEEGMVICIEPMVNAGVYRVTTDEDGWTVRTGDAKPSAHFEHMVVVREGKAEVLTSHILEHLGESAPAA